MSGAYAIWLPLGTAGAPADPARLSRMAARGWHLSEIGQGGRLALRGRAGCGRAGPVTVCGIVFLDDRAGLETRLGGADPDRSDLDCVAALFARHGPDAARDLPGAFSIVVRDRDRGATHGYRDHFGVYPFYHLSRDGALLCASDIRAALHLAAAPLDPDPVRIADFIAGQEVDATRTAFAGLARLPAAHRLTASPRAVATARYWHLRAGTPPPSDEAAAALRRHLQAATEVRLGGDGTVGCMLSGGLDSSALTALAAQSAAQAGQAPPHTLSFVYGADKPHDESGHIAAVTAACATRPHRIAVTAAPDLGALDDLLDAQMDLFLAPGLPKSARIYAEARGRGLTGLIDGHGGDEVISHGEGRLIELAATRRWGRLLAEMRGVAATHDAPVWTPYLVYIARYGGLPPRHPLRRGLLRLARLLQRRDGAVPAPANDADLLAPALRDRLDPPARYLCGHGLATPAEYRDAERLLHLQSLQDPLTEHAFEVLHRSAQAAGIAPLYPFYDRRVVSLCISLPSQAKLSGGMPRLVLRRAMAGLLPESVRLRRSKADFSDEVRHSVLAFFRARGPTPFAGLDPWLDVAAAAALRDAVLAGRRSDARSLRALWRLAVLSQWHAALARWQGQQVRGELI